MPLRVWLFLFCLAHSASAIDPCRDITEVVHASDAGYYEKTAVKAALQNPQAVSYGVELTSPNVSSAETLAEKNGISMIFVQVDAVSRLDITHLVNATERSPALLVGKFSSATDPEIKPKLDAGLQGACLENVHTKQEAEAFLDQLFFPPLGHRALGPSKANDFLAQVDAERTKANDVVVGAVSIGDEAGALAAASIVQAKGLSLLIVDYSSLRRDIDSRGPEETKMGRLAAAILRIEHAAVNAGIPLSTQVSSRAEAHKLNDRGYRHLIIGSDRVAIEKEKNRFYDMERDPRKEFQRLPGETFTDAVQSRKIVFVGFLMTPDVSYAKQLASGQRDIWIDAEHGPFSLSDVQRVLASLPMGTGSVVRASHSTHPDIPKYLAAGATGIVAPSVETAEQASAFVQLVKSQNPDALAIVMLETKNGAANAQAICAVPGIDVIHVGPYDLATSLETERGTVLHQAAISSIEEAARKNHIPLGGAVSTRSEGYAKYDKGYRFLTGISDQEALSRHFGGILQGIGTPIAP